MRIYKMENENKTTDFRIQIRTLMERKRINGKKISIAGLARLPEVNMNACTLYQYLQGNSEMLGANIEKVLNALNSL